MRLEVKGWLGVHQISELLQKMGFEVRVADVVGYLHLGGAMSAIAKRPPQTAALLSARMSHLPEPSRLRL